MPITDPAVDAFLLSLAPERDPVLLEMEEHGRARRFPLVGPAVGALLEVLARSVGARRVLELGSGFGYSAAWFLRGMPRDGTVVLTDFEEENARRGSAWLDRMGFRGRFRYEVGDALEALRGAEGPLDVVFCDMDKESYPEAVEPAIERLRPGGLLVADNALWDGTVADPACREPSTLGVREYLRRVTTDARLRTAVVPLRDGVAVSVRLTGAPSP
jgi:predicted O-methyltransferase YrrM